MNERYVARMLKAGSRRTRSSDIIEMSSILLN